MTQIIKLRAWDVLNKRFTYWTMNDLCTWDTKDEKPNALDEWQRWTGLLDKNGKEIYEGDILKESDIEIIFAVKYDSENGGYFMPKEYDEEYAWTIGAIMTDVEIIGNIHENNDLLA